MTKRHNRAKNMITSHISLPQAMTVSFEILSARKNAIAIIVYEPVNQAYTVLDDQDSPTIAHAASTRAPIIVTVLDRLQWRLMEDYFTQHHKPELFDGEPPQAIQARQ